MPVTVLYKHDRNGFTGIMQADFLPRSPYWVTSDGSSTVVTSHPRGILDADGYLKAPDGSPYVIHTPPHALPIPLHSIVVWREGQKVSELRFIPKITAGVVDVLAILRAGA